jgi:hypothetical protein
VLQHDRAGRAERDDNLQHALPPARTINTVGGPEALNAGKTFQKVSPAHNAV